MRGTKRFGALSAGNRHACIVRISLRVSGKIVFGIKLVLRAVQRRGRIIDQALDGCLISAA